MERIDAAVVGAGVVGLAVARELACSGRSVIVLEKEAAIGTGVSSRSSEVIHAGIHYPHGSLKERLCIAGKRLLYAYCERHGVAHRRIGKLTVATDEADVARLRRLADHAREAGADEELQWLDGDGARALEPGLACIAAVHTPSSGIVDSHALMLSLLGEAQDHGAVLARATPVTRAMRTANGWRVESGSDAIACDLLVNAAGLDAQAIAARIDGLDPACVPALHLAKGTYFACAGKAPFARLIYPLPVAGGLGVHLTLDLAGQARLGPDVEWTQARNYAPDPGKAGAFADAARQFWPGLDAGRLSPAYAAIRPKLSGPGEAAADFRVDGPNVHGMPGLINLFGIESPGLTACLALAAHVAALS